MTDPSQLVFAHFRVASHPDGTPVELGRGAMGVTYKAFDERLRIDVALKLITPAQIDNPRAQASFLREARAAARVHHTNVATVVFLNDTPGNFFYAMEFVEGQPLRDWLRAHPAPLPLTVAGIALQIARGLEAIHEQHFVHRDLKPANVMLVRSSRTTTGPWNESDPDLWKVKIIDFGLARVAASAPGARTQTAGFHGTALYASPEQCEERPDLDGRSDLYSLGCIMWEMLCGAPPFHARTHRELLNLHVAEPPPLSRLAHVPPSLAAVVARLLIKDPENRFPNATALIKALERCRDKIESGEEVADEQAQTTFDPSAAPISEAPRPPSTPSPSPSTTTSSSRRDLWVVAAAVLALVVPAFFFLIRGAPVRRGPAQSPRGGPIASSQSTSSTAAAERPRKSVAVLPFTNLSQDKENQNFADGVLEDILTSLTKVAGLRTISSTSVQRYRSESRGSAPEIARELGVDAIVEGTIRRDAEHVVINAKLIDGKTDASIWAEKYDRKVGDILTVQAEIATKIAEGLTTTLAPEEKRALSRTGVANAEALEYYVRARGLMSDMTDERNVLTAISALRSAVAADPKFTKAFAQLAMAESQIYDWGDRSAERRKAARDAAERAMELDPQMPEAQLALANYYYHVERDFAKARAYFNAALAVMPENPDILYGLAGMDRREGKWAEAAAKFEKVAEVNPMATETPGAAPDTVEPLKLFNAVNTYIYMHQYEDAWRVLQKALKRAPSSPALRIVKGQLFLSWKGDLAPMREDLATRPDTVPDAQTYVLDKVQLLLFERKFDDALAALRASEFKLGGGQINYVTRQSLEAEILTQAGRNSEARPIWRRAANELSQALQENPGDTRIRMAYALALAGAGDEPDRAVKEARLAAAQLPMQKDALDGPAYQANLALVLFRAGQPEEAAKIVSTIRRIPSIIYEADFNLLPAWDFLRTLNSDHLQR